MSATLRVAPERLFTIVPVFNEAENIPRLMETFRHLAAGWAARYSPEFIVCDDGSVDETVALCHAHGEGLTLHVLSTGRNRGPGYAFGTGFAHLVGCIDARDWVITMEGDNTSRDELIERMLKRSIEGYDVVLASPYMYGGGIVNTSAGRLLISHVANAFVKEFLGLHGILTMSSFFRLYRGSVLLALQSCYGPRVLERAGFESMVELLMKLTYLRTTISEVPMVLDSTRRRGKSKMKIFRTARGYLTLLLHRRHWQQDAVAWLERSAPSKTVLHVG